MQAKQDMQNMQDMQDMQAKQDMQNMQDMQDMQADNIFIIKHENTEYLIIVELPDITIKNVNLDLKFKGCLTSGHGYQGFITYDLLLDALQYELSTRETIKFDMSEDYDNLVMSFCLGEFRREKKYYVVNLQNTFKTISDKINEISQTDTENVEYSEEDNEGREETAAIKYSNFIIKKIESLSKKYENLKKQNTLLIETVCNLEKTNYQYKMLKISCNMPKLPYLSFMYPEWATFEEFKKLPGFAEISAAYNFKNYVIGAVVSSKAYIFINYEESKYYYTENSLVFDEKKIGFVSCDLKNKESNNNDQPNYNLYYADIIEKNKASYNGMQCEITDRFNSSCYVEKSKIKGIRNYYCDKFNNYIGLFRIGFLLLNPKFYEYNLEFLIKLSTDRPIINLYVKDKLRTRDYTLIKANDLKLPNKKGYIYDKRVNYPSYIYYDTEEKEE